MAVVAAPAADPNAKFFPELVHRRPPFLRLGARDRRCSLIGVVPKGGGSQGAQHDRAAALERLFRETQYLQRFYSLPLMRGVA